MKTAAEIILKRPVKILQIFSNILLYKKDEKSFDDRKELLEWRPARSGNGHVKEGRLFLPETILSHRDLYRCNMITIWDDISTRQHYMRDIVPNDCLVLTAPRKLGNFKIYQNGDNLELYLRYNYFYIGIPERKSIQLCELRPGEPVEIRINGKTDFSLFSRRGRTFIDQHYIFEYTGDFKSFTPLQASTDPAEKNIPLPAKRVNMIKPLW